MQHSPQPAPRSRRRRRGPKRLPMILACVFALALILALSPLSPTEKALNVNGVSVSQHAGLLISEVMTDNASALPDENGSFGDYVELWNSTENEMSLKNISLSDRAAKAKFVFPDVILQAGGRVIIFCDRTNQVDPAYPFHAKFSLTSMGGETVFLFDSDGYQLDSVTVPTLNADECYQRAADGSFEVSESYSPGYENTQAGHDAYLANYSLTPGALQINEIMPAPRSGLRDEDDELSDWIEIHNTTAQAIELENYALSDNPQRPLKWSFPSGAVIPAGGYYVVFCSGKDRAGEAGGIPHTNFSLSAEGETVTLSTRNGQMVDRVTYENVGADVSFGRVPGTDGFKLYTLATPGAANDAGGASSADRYMRAINVSGVYISEAMSSNDTVNPIAGATPCDYAEVYNASTEVVDLSGWGLSDNVNWPRKWQFPAGTSIWPGEYKVILLDKSASAGTNASALHANYALSRAGGETLTLSDSTGRVLDKLYLPEIPSGISYGRTLGVDGFFYYDAPTPGAANPTGFKGFAAKPALSMEGGLYEGVITVEIAADAGADIRYTLDGSIPTLENSILYTEPIVFTDTGTLRARAFISGLQPSSTVTATYVMNTYYTLPIVCLTMDPEELWNNTDGIYASGEGVDLKSYTKIPFKNPEPVYRTFGKVARPGYCEMFEQGGNVMISQGVEFGLIGQYSLDMPQKSFKVTAKAAQGAKYFNAKLFSDREYTEYKSFVLRVSGNDCVWTRMVDGVQSRLVDLIDTTVIHQAWNPVVVYLNGSYWGHYNMRERVSRYFVAQHEGLSLEQADSIDILESNSKVYYGSATEYKALLAKAKTLSPGKNQGDLQYLLDNIDVDNYFDYIIFESFFANSDTGNIRYYKVPGGKWRWILYDMDYGLFDSVTNGIKICLNPKGTGVGNAIDNTLIRKLLESDEMLDKFLTRYGEIYQQLTTDVMLAMIDECYAILKPEMQMHFERWAEQNLKSISSDQPQTADGCIRYWNTRVDRLRNVVRKRPTLCWEQIQDWFGLTNAQMEGYFGKKPEFPEGVY